MTIKFLVPAALALSVLAVPALAYEYPNNDVPITGSQLTSKPSIRSNTTMSGSFLQPKADVTVTNNDYWMRMRLRHAYDQGYNDGYYDRSYDR